MHGFVFFRNFLRSPLRVGSIWPSSRHLARSMLKGIDYEKHMIVELGCGTGALTRHISLNLINTSNYIGFEISADLHQRLTQNFKHLRIIGESATRIADHHPLADRPLDFVVSSLPFTTLPPELTQKILDVYAAALRPGGVFRLFLYAHTAQLPRNQRLLQQLLKHFEFVESEVVFRNIPPAQVITFRKSPEGDGQNSSSRKQMDDSL